MTYVLIESIFIDRWVAAEIVGETAKLWEVRTLKTSSVRRCHKEGTRLLRGYDTPEAAQRAATQLTAKVVGARKHFEQRKQDLLDQFDKETTNG